MSSPTFSDPEAAREAGRKGGQRAAELKRLRREDPEEYLRQTFEAEAPGLVNLLLDAAHGRGPFADSVECPHCQEQVPISGLPADKRLSAITQALAYGVGRPATQKPTAPKEPEKPKPGLLVE